MVDHIEYFKVAKAATVAGIIFGVLQAIVTVIITLIWLNSTPETLTNLSNLTFFIGRSFVIGIMSGVLGGIIFGYIYIATYNKLPGSTRVTKAMILGIMYWVIFSVVIGYFRRSEYGLTYYGINIIVGLFLYLFWGFLFVKIWNKYKSEPTVPQALPLEIGGAK